MDPDDIGIAVDEASRSEATPSAIRRFTSEHFEKARREAGDLLPPLRKAGLADAINGMFAFTVDGMPLMGQWREVDGLWIAEAIWITHSLGAARAMAEWIVDGVPSIDLRECDVNRFHPHVYSRSYIRERATQQYREVYDIIHPLQQIRSPRNLRVSPFYRRMEDLGGVFFENAGWERPQWFNSNGKMLEGRRDWPDRTGWEAQFWSPIQGVEHHGTREGVSIYDLTPFTKLEVRGRGALEYLQRLCANQIDCPPGKVVYTSMLNKNGGIVCDLTITRLESERFMVVTGGSTGVRDLAWMRTHLPEGGDHDGSAVQILDISASLCCIGLWGPRASALLHNLTETGIQEEGGESPSEPFTARRIMIGNIPTLALRVSYVGEQGWEIYTETNYGLGLWDTLWEAGSECGLIAAGGAAFDSLRLEKGFRLWGSEIHTEYNPLEAGLGFAVKFDKGDFLGREALLRFRDRGLTRKLCRMYFEEPGRVVMGKEPIIGDGAVLGHVTSSNYGYSVGRGIAYGYLPIDYAKEGTDVEISYFGAKHPAKVVAER